MRPLMPFDRIARRSPFAWITAEGSRGPIKAPRRRRSDLGYASRRQAADAARAGRAGVRAPVATAFDNETDFSGKEAAAMRPPSEGWRVRNGTMTRRIRDPSGTSVSVV